MGNISKIDLFKTTNVLDNILEEIHQLIFNEFKRRQNPFSRTTLPTEKVSFFINHYQSILNEIKDLLVTYHEILDELEDVKDKDSIDTSIEEPKSNIYEIENETKFNISENNKCDKKITTPIKDENDIILTEDKIIEFINQYDFLKYDPTSETKKEFIDYITLAYNLSNTNKNILEKALDYWIACYSLKVNTDLNLITYLLTDNDFYYIFNLNKNQFPTLESFLLRCVQREDKSKVNLYIDKTYHCLTPYFETKYFSLEEKPYRIKPHRLIYLINKAYNKGIISLIRYNFLKYIFDYKVDIKLDSNTYQETRIIGRPEIRVTPILTQNTLTYNDIYNIFKNYSELQYLIRKTFKTQTMKKYADFRSYAYIYNLTATYDMTIPIENMQFTNRMVHFCIKLITKNNTKIKKDRNIQLIFKDLRNQFPIFGR